MATAHVRHRRSSIADTKPMELFWREILRVTHNGWQRVTAGGCALRGRLFVPPAHSRGMSGQRKALFCLGCGRHQKGVMLKWFFAFVCK